MTSKEALETIGMTKTNNIKSASLSKPRVMYLVKELRKKEINAIKQDLNKLEKLEKENLVLLVNKNAAQSIAKKFKQENDKLKKIIEILKNKNVDIYELLKSKNVVDYNNLTWSTYDFNGVELTDEEYSLLKEVLGND